MRTNIMDIQAPASYESIREIRTQLSNKIASLVSNQSITNAMSTTLSELFTNFVEHSDTAETLSLCAAKMGSGLTLTLTCIQAENTETTLKEWLNTPDPNPLDAFDLQRSGGRGATLVKTLCPTIAVTPSQEQGPLSWQNGFIAYWPYALTKSTPRLMLIDDDPAQRALYSSFLSTVFTVHACSGAREAMAMLEKNIPDIIVCDIHMPEINGIEFREQLIRIEKFAFVPFVFLSGDTRDELKNTLIHLGFDAWLEKPCNKQLLLQTASQVIARSVQVKQALDNQTARNISHALKPKLPPAIPGWALESESHNTGCGGGDLLLIESRDNKTLIVLLDIMGHDIAAKFFSYAFLGFLRGFIASHKTLPAPNTLLEHLSDAIYLDSLLSGSLCTGLAIALYPNGHIEYANAGHPPAVIIDSNRCESLAPPEMLAGIQPKMRYALNKHQLTNGQRIACFTDGVIEQLAEQTYEQQSRALQQQLINTAAYPLHTACREIFSYIEKANGGHYSDDSLLLFMEH